MSINPRVSLLSSINYDKAGNNQNNNASYSLLNNQLNTSDFYTITYDSMGNIKTKYNKLTKERTSYTFNARNQLIQYTKQDENNNTTKTLTFTYDAFNRRVSKADTSAGSATVTQKYLYDGDAIVAILDNQNQVIATITHDESIDTPLSITNQNGTFYYHRDHQGSIVALTDSTGTVVESFTYDNHYGAIVNHTKTVETNNAYAYTGRELDTDELYYYRARYYDSTTQRFLGEDPIGFSSGDFNWYRYVGNNPVNGIDPSGLFNIPGPTDSFYAGYFTGAYFYGNGATFDLNKHLDLGTKFYNAPSVQNAISHFTNQTKGIKCSPCENKHIRKKIITDVTLEEGLFAVGHSTFFMEANCINGKWSFHFYIRDFFRQPLVTGPIHIYEGELPGGTPYPIIWDYNQ